jgi:hypothetical protein
MADGGPSEHQKMCSFFEEEGVTVTVNSERYVSMLRNFLHPRMEEIVEEEELGDVWFQQDGTAALTAQNSINVLGEIFPGRLVSLRGNFSRTSGLSEGCCGVACTVTRFEHL